MRKTGLLHPELCRTITAMGHTDSLVVADAGLPIPKGVERIDLALVPGLPGFLSTVESILAEFKVESAICAEEIVTLNPIVLEGLQALLGDIPLHFIPHEGFKRKTGEASAVVRSGECTPYANVILVAGVTF
jgi:D-ribose pyranase